MSLSFEVIILNLLLEKKNGNYKYGDFFPTCLVSVSWDAKPLITSLQKPRQWNVFFPQFNVRKPVGGFTFKGI